MGTGAMGTGAMGTRALGTRAIEKGAPGPVPKSCAVLTDSRSLATGWLALGTVGFLNLPVYWWPLECARNLASYLAPCALLLGIFLLYRGSGRSVSPGRWRRAHHIGLGAATSAGALYLLLPAVPFYLPDRAPVAHLYPVQAAPPAAVGFEFTWMVANVHGANKRHADVRQVITDQRPDIVGILECTPDWARALEGLYPYSSVVTRTDDFGLALFSKFPLATEPDPAFFRHAPPALRVQLSLRPDLPVSVFLLHTLPPVGNYALFDNYLVLRRVATELRQLSLSALVMGDVNATPYSPLYEVLVQGGDLTNVFWGRGLPATWPSGLGPLGLTLDHLFYRGPFEVVDARPIALPGSDHRGLLARVRVSGKVIPVSREWAGEE